MGHYLERYWRSDSWYGASGSYHPYVPSKLAGARLTISPAASDLVARATADLARLDMSAETLRFTEPLARLLMRTEAIASSRIEGLEAPAKKVLEIEALEELDVAHSPSSTEAAVLANITALQDALESVASGSPLTTGLLCDINRRLLADGPLEEKGGVLRREQNWIGGSNFSPVGAAYVPPEPELVPELVDDLVEFCNTSKLPALATAAVAHAQFETIHPFVDGNGRTGRALGLVILRARGVCERCTPPVSLALASQRSTYLNELVAFRDDEPKEADTDTRDRDVSPFVSFYTRAAAASVGLALQFETRAQAIEHVWRERVKPRKNSAADLLLSLLPSNPVVSLKSTMRLTGRSDEACRRALTSLVDAGVLSQNARNRKSGLFVASEILDEFTAFERAVATPGADTSVARPGTPVPQRRPARPYGA